MSDVEAPTSNAKSSTTTMNHSTSQESQKNTLATFVNSLPVTIIMTVFTIYCLYSEDLKVITTSPSCKSLTACKDTFGGSDPAFAVISLISFVLFFTEMCTLCWCQEGYWMWPDIKKFKYDPEEPNRTYMSRLMYLMPGSFYFWLDLLATFSLIFEIPIFLNALLASDNTETFDISYQDSSRADSSNTDSAASAAADAKASKASRAGARAGRVVKIIRMIRLIRLVKLFKYAEQTKHREDGKEHQVVPEEEEEEESDMPESHVGNEMTERTTKKVIVGILIMLIMIPNLQDVPVNHTPEHMVRLLSAQRVDAMQYYLKNGNDTNYTLYKEMWQETELYMINTMTQDTHESDCFSITYEGFLDDVGNDGSTTKAADSKDPSEVDGGLREDEFEVKVITNNVTKIIAEFNRVEFKKRSAKYAAWLTTCVILLLAVITMLFTADVNNLVLRPIETMISLVREISDNPLAKEFKSVSKSDMNKNDGMETTLILQTIHKIAGLMRVGFGEAGAEIIATNLSKSDSHNMSLLGDGVKIKSIFGFCDIRNFTDTTECLQEEVMLFVNRIAHILHGIVVQCKGAANKNIGDAFLLTWKLNETEMGKGGNQEYVGDQALLSLLKTTAEMARHEDFICNFSSTALSILYERMLGYKCKMGCGLHMGWAVEGAIGSDKKIDASYISPHVNWAEFLESSTKEYGVPVLMSEPFYKLLSDDVKKFCRQVDHIKKSASDEVTGLYTYDVNPDYDFKAKAVMDAKKEEIEHQDQTRKQRKQRRTMNLKGKSPPPQVRTTFMANHMASVRSEINDGSVKFSDRTIAGAPRKSMKHKHSALHVDGGEHGGDSHGNHSGLGNAPEIILEKYTTAIWLTDEDLVAMRTHMNDEILETWDSGMHAFIEGDWAKAREKFNRVLEITNDKDGPAKNILRHMDNDYGGKVPMDW
eukprot:CAMPEP_0118655946 /NCGR_PEP_ID=MMETSP0785-20121206/13221_1 /TAXON_ID=91992 /ORGANISM="Bolidomonas pacifica, Strain CCMP 1866" /LENGTH=930 /DNA_ID=CAMNT_0006548761 /DNA_START=290 /DNA_END=3079 /DNA_ORIENTATION=-